MDYQIEYPRSFKVSSERFVSLWNHEPALAALGTARRSKDPTDTFDGGLAIAAIVGTVAIHIGASAIFEGLKSLFSKEVRVERFELEESETPDGTKILRIRMERTS